MGLGNILSIYLRYNNLQSLQIRIFADLTNLASLDLSYNGLTSLTVEVFIGLSHLSNLNLSENNFKSLDERSLATTGSLTGLRDLILLDLGGNEIESIDVDTFAGVSDISTLNLSGNILDTPLVGCFRGLIKLSTLYLSSNKITSLHDEIFANLTKLERLHLNDNNIVSLQAGIFTSLDHLILLDLSHNRIISLRIGTFAGLASLERLSLSWNRLIFIQEGIFDGLDKLLFIDLSGNIKLSIRESTFSKLPDMVNVYTYQEYCDCVLVDGNKYNCSSDGRISPYSSCRLLAFSSLTIFMTVFGVGAILGNVFVLIWKRLHWGEENKVQSILLSNLAMSDLLMGIYMLVIAFADYDFDENYLVNSPDWRCSLTCFTAGTLAITSSEASVFFITLISIDRFIRIKYPYTRRRLRIKSTKVTAVILWLFAIALGVVPYIIANLYCKYPSYIDALIFIYDVPDVCVGLPLSRIAYSSEHPQPSMYYSIALFMGLNFMSFLIILGCYIEIIRVVRFSSRRSGNSKSMQKQIRLTTRVAAIVATDFCCWFPIIILSILGQSGVIQVNGVAYAALTTFVLPINSTINPFLYTFAIQLSKRPKQKRNPRKTKNVQNQPERNELKIKNVIPDVQEEAPCGMHQKTQNITSKALIKDNSEQNRGRRQIETNKKTEQGGTLSFEQKTGQRRVGSLNPAQRQGRTLSSEQKTEQRQGGSLNPAQRQGRTLSSEQKTEQRQGGNFSSEKKAEERQEEHLSSEQNTVRTQGICIFEQTTGERGGTSSPVQKTDERTRVNLSPGKTTDERKCVNLSPERKDEEGKGESLSSEHKTEEKEGGNLISEQKTRDR